MADEITINIKTITKTIGILAISIFLIFAFKNIFLNNSDDNDLVNGGQTGSNKVEIKDGIQIINLGVANYNYDPNTITIKEGMPVKIIGNMNQLQGCLRSFIIPKLGISKLFTKGDNILEFTPKQKGTFKFSCTMGMGTGNLIVE